MELDCRLTKDGVVVVLHDGTTGRLLEGPDTDVSTMTLAELRARTWKVIRSPKVADADVTPLSVAEKALAAHPVPTLEEVIVFCKSRNLKLMIEVKEVMRPTLLAQRMRELYAVRREEGGEASG